MTRTRVLFSVACAAAATAAIAACKSESRPPVSDGPGTVDPSRGAGAGDGGSSGDGGTAGLFASFPGFRPTGLAASGDVTFLTLASLDGSQPGEVVTVDASGAVTVLVSNAVSPALPALGPNELFYVDSPATVTPRAVMRVDLGNVAAGPTAVIAGVESPGGLLVVGGGIFVSSSSGGTGVEVDLVGLEGGVSSPVTSVAGDFTPGEIVTDGANVIFVASTLGGGEIASASFAGGPANVVTANPGGTIGSLAISSNAVLFTATSGTTGAIDAVTSVGGPVTTLVGGIDSPGALAADGTYVYYTSNAVDGTIWRLPLANDAGAAPELLSPGASPAFLAIGTTAVFATIDEGLVRIPR